MPVTGGIGFLSSHFYTLLIDEGYDVLCIDNYFTTRQYNIANLLSLSQLEATQQGMLKWTISYLPVRSRTNTLRSSRLASWPNRAVERSPAWQNLRPARRVATCLP